MLFNSPEFLFAFLPVAFLVFFWVAKFSRAAATLWLAIASLFFYGWWNPVFVPLLLASIVFNFVVGKKLVERGAGDTSRLLVGAAIAINLVLLGFFKYMDFFIETANTLGANLSLMRLVLPLGISFFTFTQIAFLVDCHRREVSETNFVPYLLFVTWFPHLIAGPVLHHKQMMPQFADSRVYRPDHLSISIGLTLFALGLFKKVVIADRLGIPANASFGNVADGNTIALIEAWIGALSFSFQLYFDFSGYSDMAVGLSRMFNIKLPINFNSPYTARNIAEFWKRWHITLSTFLRDYLYIPLGGNRLSRSRRYLNLMVTMLLGGLWHGAGWNFVLWGGLHGAFLVVCHATSFGNSDSRTAKTLATILTFVLVTIAWVPFRSPDIMTAMVYLKGMAGLNGIVVPHSIGGLLGSWLPFVHSGELDLAGASVGKALVSLLVAASITWLLPNSQKWLADYSPAWGDTEKAGRIAWKPSIAYALFCGVLFYVAMLNIKHNSPFLYYQF